MAGYEGDFQGDDIDNLIDNDVEKDSEGYLDKAMKKLGGKGKKRAFARGYINTLDGFSIVGEALYKKIKKEDLYEDGGFSMGLNTARAVKTPMTKGETISYIVGGAAGVATIIAAPFTMAAPPLMEFGNWLHRKIKKRKDDNVY